jgi:FixJ family two-component response regulator
MPEPRQSKAVIAIVDDDPSVRQGLQRLIRSLGWKAETFASAQDSWPALRLTRQVVWCWTCKCPI